MILLNEDNTTLDKAQSLANIVENIKKNMSKLKLNVNSGDKNLLNLFEFCKVIFKTIKN